MSIRHRLFYNKFLPKPQEFDNPHLTQLFQRLEIEEMTLYASYFMQMLYIRHFIPFLNAETYIPSVT